MLDRCFKLFTMTPAVSVILIFLNGEEFIAEAVDSVLVQTMQDFELLLVDDGSTDRASEIAQGYANRDFRITYLTHAGHINKGMSATRNLGLRHAKGEYVAFIDVDDVWRPDKLAAQLKVFEKHPKLRMVCGSANYWSSWMGGDDRIIKSGHAQDSLILPPEATLNVYPLGRASAPCLDALLPLPFVRAIGGFEEQFKGMYEDQAFLAKVYLAAPIWFDSRVWLDYRQHQSSCVTTSHREGGYHEVREQFLRWFQDYLSRNRNTAVENAVSRALLPYDYPLTFWCLSLPHRVFSLASRLFFRDA